MRRAAPTRIALVGAESTGKSTLALSLTARLREHGVWAEHVPESASSAPFPPAVLDTDPAAHAYMVTAKMAAESAVAVKPNVRVIISDRSPFDHAAYLAVRFNNLPLQDDAIITAARAWLRHYDFIFHLRTAGAAYVEDGHRQAAEENDYREKVDAFLAAALPPQRTVKVSGTFEKRSEFVHRYLWAQMLGFGDEG